MKSKLPNLHNISNPLSLEVADMLYAEEEDDKFSKAMIATRVKHLTLKEEMTVVLLNFGYTPEEIAAYRDMTLQAVYMTIKRATERIQKENDRT